MFIQVENLVKKYKQNEVLRGLNFEVEKSDELAIVGSSGCGKSTLLYILGGLEKPDSGRVLIEGVEISKMSDAELSAFRNTQIGFVFQFHFLLPSMSCLENMLLPAKIGGFERAHCRCGRHRVYVEGQWISAVGAHQSYNF